MLAGRMRMAASSSAVPWYLSGGAPTPIAAWTLKGAASQAAGQVNLVNPGTFDLSGGVTPTWSAASGLIFNGTTQYLLTGITPVAGYVMVVRFAGGVTGSVRCPLGGRGSSLTRLSVQPTSTTNVRFFQYGGSASKAGEVTAGVMGLTPTTGYLNGAFDLSYDPSWSGTPAAIVLGAFNGDGTISQYWPGSVQAAAVWNVSANHAVWVPAVSAAVAAL